MFTDSMLSIQSLQKRTIVEAKLFKGGCVEHFHINKSFGEISIISRNKWDHHWEQAWQPLSRTLHSYFSVPPRSIWLVICWTALQHKNRMRGLLLCQCRWSWSCQEFFASGRWWEQRKGKWSHAYPLQWSNFKSDWRFTGRWCRRQGGPARVAVCNLSLTRWN